MRGRDDWALYDRDAVILIGGLLALQTIMLSTMLWL